MRAPQLCLQNVIAGDALILRKAPPAVHPADRRVVAGEVLLQPRKLPLRFYIQNTITEISVLCQQVKEIAHQHTEGAAGNDVGGIIAGSCTLLFSDFCIMLFQYGSQRRKLRRLQFGKIIPVPERQVASGNEAVSRANRSHFGSDLCFLPPFARRIFRCFHPDLPVPILFWVKTGSRS